MSRVAPTEPGGLLASIQPEPDRDHYGRYLLPHTGSGQAKVVPWTRATTWAQTLSDKFGLNRWEKRMAAKGLAMRPDLLAMVASLDVVRDKDQVDAVVEQAKEAAAASSGANLGTSVHRFTEAVDRGEKVTIPAPWDRDVEAFGDTLAVNGLRVLPEYIERIVVVPELAVAGTLDRIVELPDGRLAILDLKTGKDLKYAWPEIAIQLALYAHASHMWDGIAAQYEPMPEVRQDRAIVAHVPVGTGTCTLYTVDIEAGWAAAQLCDPVRSWRKQRGLSAQFKGGTIIDRIARSKTKAELRALWTQAKANGLDTQEVADTIRERMANL